MKLWYTQIGRNRRQTSAWNRNGVCDNQQNITIENDQNKQPKRRK